MPPKSEAQRAAMHAAASGHSTLGIPASVGAEFVATDAGGKLPVKAVPKRKKRPGQYTLPRDKPSKGRRK